MSLADTKSQIAAFASKRIATRPELLNSENFPSDIWADLGSEGLLGLCIDSAYGGKSHNLKDLSEFAETFAEAAACPGLTMSWLGHNLMGRLLIQDIGTEEQRETWLPNIANGTVTPAVAISEPGAGAHPKFLTTEAEEVGDALCLGGEKAYVTNGSIAGLFVVLAITGYNEARKEFSALLVPSTSPGISIRPMDPPINFLRPAPHARIQFENVIVPSQDILGEKGSGFDVVSKRVRLVEDIVGLGAAAGNLSAIIRTISRDALAGKSVTAELEEGIGALMGIQATLSTIAKQSVIELTEGSRATSAGGAKALQSAASQLIISLVQPLNLPEGHPLLLLHRDLQKSLSIAGRAHKIQNQKKGAAFLQGL